MLIQQFKNKENLIINLILMQLAQNQRNRLSLRNLKHLGIPRKNRRNNNLLKKRQMRNKGSHMKNLNNKVRGQLVDLAENLKKREKQLQVIHHKNKNRPENQQIRKLKIN